MAVVRKIRRGRAKGKQPKTVISSLPTKPNVPPVNFLEYCIMIFGRKGIGKTTLASMLSRTKESKVLVFMLEKSRRNLAIYQKPEKGEKYPTWETILGWTEKFINDPSFSMIVFDTIDKLYDLCYKHVCKENGVKHPKEKGSKEASGVWIEIAAEFNAYLQTVAESGKGIIFISHESVRDLEAKRLREFKKEASGEDGEEIEIRRIEPSCPPAAWRAAQEMADYVLYYGYRNRKRTLTVRDTGDYFLVSAGVDGRFMDPQGNPLNTFYVGETPQEAKKTLLAAFNNEVQDIDYVPPRKKKRPVNKRPIRRKVRR